MPRGVFRELLAEFFGTFVLIVFGVGVVAQVVLSRSAAGTFLSINIAWGLAVTMGCYVSAGVTGAHLNPAVTLALAARRAFPWNKVAPYAAAQIAGAFTASAVVFLTYHEALAAFDGGVRQVLGAQGTAGIWATYPQPFLSTFPGGFIDQVVGTALLVACIFGITDSRNSPAPAGHGGNVRTHQRVAPAAALPALRRIFSSAYLTPLPLYGSGGRSSRMAAATWPSSSLSALASVTTTCLSTLAVTSGGSW